MAALQSLHILIIGALTMASIAGVTDMLEKHVLAFCSIASMWLLMFGLNILLSRRGITFSH